MTDSTAAAERPDYGLDAPGVVRNLFLAAAAGLLVWGSARAGLWSGQLAVPLPGGNQLRVALSAAGLWTGLGCAFMAIWMIWESKVGKLKRRERLLSLLVWTGRERVLDVGCGRGLMLIGAAKRLTTGKATGIDIWQEEDLSGNKPEATRDNARREGVADRVEIETADMRKLPFPDGTFDTAVSSAAIHNLYAAPDRAQAIAEVARVLRPGGRAVIDDIRHLREYAAIFEGRGCTARQVGSPILAVLLGLITFGSLRPGTILVEKVAR